MNNKVEMVREELCDLLGVNNECLKAIIKKNKLEDRINNSGNNYTYIGQYKNGRNVIYQLELSEESNVWRQLQNTYGIRDYDKHTKYTIARIFNLDKPRSTVVKISNTNITDKTAKRYDNILLNENMILKSNKWNKKSDSAFNVVYRMFDKNNDIIYIGKSNDLVKRMNGHSCEEKENDWFNKEVDRIEYITFNAYGDCSIAEMYFITKVKPKYNKDFITWETSINIDMFDNMVWNIAEIEEDEINVYGKGENYDRVIRLLKYRTKVNSK